MAEFKRIGPLQWNVPIVDSGGRPTSEFMRRLQLLLEAGGSTQGGLGDKVDKTTRVDAGVGLSGGGPLSDDIVIDLDASLGDLDDIDFTSPPSDGQVIAYDEASSMWKPVDQTGGGTSPALSAHQHWRILINANNGSGAVAIGEIEMRDVPGGPDQCSGGVASASSANGPFVPANAFDDNGGATFWAATSVVEWIGYAFPAPVVVQQVAITSRADGFVADAPRSFEVQYSDDGINWNTAWGSVYTREWASNETRMESNPDIGSGGGGGGGSGTLTHYRYPIFGGHGPIEPIWGEDGESIYVELTHV